MIDVLFLNLIFDGTLLFIPWASYDTDFLLDW